MTRRIKITVSAYMEDDSDRNCAALLAAAIRGFALRDDVRTGTVERLDYSIRIPRADDRIHVTSSVEQDYT